MKKIFLILLSLIIISKNSLAQSGEKRKGAVIEKNITRTTSNITLNDLETFKNQFAEWNVGNLHFYSRNNLNDKNYYFSGEKVSPIFSQHLPKDLKSTVTQKGKEPYHIALVRGDGLDDYYILRINDGRNNNVLVLYELKNEQLKAKKTLAYFYKKGKRTFQRDSWMQDVDGDTRLDLIQKTLIKDSNGKVKKEKTRVFLQNKKGKYKRSRRAKIEKEDYRMEKIK